MVHVEDRQLRLFSTFHRLPSANFTNYAGLWVKLKARRAPFANDRYHEALLQEEPTLNDR